MRTRRREMRRDRTRRDRVGRTIVRYVDFSTRIFRRDSRKWRIYRVFDFATRFRASGIKSLVEYSCG